ncbi:transcription factor IIIB 90 kDa subunit isoform X2, partial [Ixodes scapularis]
MQNPCLYIVRFAHHLEFADKTHEVSMTALRLVQRMKRDWMHTGRRPSGLCGAALLVASRLHDFSRTIKDLVRVVKVCETTIRKRLTEFGDTPSSRLTLEEFMTIDLEEEQDPPCFKAARRKQKGALDDPGKVDRATQEVSELQKKIEGELEDRRRKVRGRFARFAKEDTLTQEEEKEISHGFIIENTMATINDCLDDTQSSRGSDNGATSAAPPPLRVTSEPRDNDEDASSDDAATEAEAPLTERNRNLVTSLRPTAATLGLKESIEECMRVRDCIEDTEETGELDLDGLDDDELDSYIMTDAEVKLKTRFWTMHHAEYLKEQEEKEARRAQEMEENANKPEPKKRKRRKRTNVQANTAGEAIEKMLQEKKISNKINYDVLKSLNSTDVGFPLEPQPPQGTSEVDLVETASVVSETTKKKRKEKPPPKLTSLMSTMKSIA